MAERTDIIVAGGGIGGLACTLALAQAGCSVRVLERAPEFREVGAGIQMAPNAGRALMDLGVFDQVMAQGYCPPKLAFMHAVTGEALTTIPFDDGFIARYGAPWVTLHRNDLLQILQSACLAHANVELLTGKTVTAIESGDEVARAACEDGSSYEGYGLIVADGVASRLRREFCDDEPVTSGYVDFRAIMPWSNVVGQETSGDVMAWVGPALHAMQYPVRRGEVYNQLAGILSRPFRAGDSVWGTAEEFAERFEIVCPALRSALPNLLASNARYELRDRAPAPSWLKGRMLMLGDAAHPMMPFFGQGGCQALEDAQALSAVVRHYRKGAARDWAPRALAAVEAIRRPRASRLQTESRLFGDVWHFEGMAGVVRDELFKRVPPGDFTYTDRLYLPGFQGEATPESWLTENG